MLHIPEVGSLTWLPIVGCAPELELGVRYPSAKQASLMSLRFTRISQDEALRIARLKAQGPVPDDYETSEHTEAVYEWAQEVIAKTAACARIVGEPSPIGDPSRAESEKARALEIVGRLTLGEQVLQAIKILHEVGRLPESFRPPPPGGGDKAEG